MKPWFLYLIRTRSGSLYTGISTEPARRLREHGEAGSKGAKALRGRGPLKMVFQQPFADRSQASRAEAQVKRLSKQQKEQLIKGTLPLELC